MSTHIKILTHKDIKFFDSPPEFNGIERKLFFNLTNTAKELAHSLKTPMNKIGFILQFGYLKAVNKFFVAHKFNVFKQSQYVPIRADFYKS